MNEVKLAKPIFKDTNTKMVTANGEVVWYVKEKDILAERKECQVALDKQKERADELKKDKEYCWEVHGDLSARDFDKIYDLENQVKTTKAKLKKVEKERGNAIETMDENYNLYAFLKEAVEKEGIGIYKDNVINERAKLAEERLEQRTKYERNLERRYLEKEKLADAWSKATGFKTVEAFTKAAAAMGEPAKYTAKLEADLKKAELKLNNERNFNRAIFFLLKDQGISVDADLDEISEGNWHINGVTLVNERAEKLKAKLQQLHDFIGDGTIYAREQIARINATQAKLKGVKRQLDNTNETMDAMWNRNRELETKLIECKKENSLREDALWKLLGSEDAAKEYVKTKAKLKEAADEIERIANRDDIGAGMTPNKIRYIKELRTLAKKLRDAP